MILKLSRLIRARAHGDEGIAMIMVMGTIMVLTVLLGVTIGLRHQRAAAGPSRPGLERCAGGGPVGRR